MISPKSWLLLSMIITFTTLAPSHADAGALWYNGDYDNRDSLTNENFVPINVGGKYVFQKSLVYENFVVATGQTWTLSNVFADVQMAYYVAPVTATWEIRSGVSAGNGGVLVASGDTAATATAITPNPSNYYGDPEYRVSATVTGVTLTAGTYWLAVAPDSAGYYGDQSYLETTSGANSVGTPAGNDGNSFISNTFPTSGASSFNFTPTTTALAGDGDGPKIDFSMGINGTVTLAAVPEPSSLLMVAVGLLGSSAFLRLRSKSRAS